MIQLLPRCIRLLLIAIVPLLSIACGGTKTYQVEGTVVWEDGSSAAELEGGTVVFESVDQKLSSRGEIGKNGHFRMSTVKPGDGVPEGEYRAVVIQSPALSRNPVRTLDSRFERYATSGLTYTVEPRDTKDAILKVERAKKE